MRSGRLRIDSYESGVGETIVITFPSGGIGLVDAHPSKFTDRPSISDIVKGRKLHFVCLTHPHADHGADLVTVLNDHNEIESFWHTISEIPAFIYGIEQTVSFPSSVRQYAKKLNQDWAKFLCDIFAAVGERNLRPHQLRSDLGSHHIDGVEIHCLSPDEGHQQEFTSAYHKKLTDPAIKVPDPNLISAVLALRFGDGVVILGSDALKRNWKSAIAGFRRRSLPKARILKVPHHGAKNALDVRRQRFSYLDLCAVDPRPTAVLFAGDSRHPDSGVFSLLKARTNLICVSNGQKTQNPGSNPLQLQLPGAIAVQPAPICNPVVSIEMDQTGSVDILTGTRCKVGCFPEA